MSGEERSKRVATSWSAGASAERAGTETELSKTVRKLEGLYDAIADGLRTPGLKDRLEALESRKTELEAQLSAPEPSPVRLHPNLAGLYREKVAQLAETLKDPEIRTPALELLRGLIERVTVSESPEGPVLDLEGEIVALIDLAQPGESRDVDPRSVKVVAGAGNQRHLLFDAWA